MARVKVVKVDGEPEYHELFKRLSLASSQHPTPPYSNLNELIKDKPRQVKRKARKAVGLPASEDVAVLAAMLKSLQDAVEDHLGHGTSSAATAIPHLLALYKEDILDAFVYLDLQFIDLPFRDKPLRETSAAYAGYGLGLCSNYTDLITCKRELDNWPQKVVMAVLYTQSALTVSLSITKSAYSLFEPQYRHLEDFTLGYGARHDYLSQDYYWELVRDRLGEIMIQNRYERPAHVLLLGENAHDKKFASILAEVLESVMQKKPKVWQEDAEGVAAKGVAELPKRAPWDPYRRSGKDDGFKGLVEDIDSLLLVSDNSLAE